MSTPHLRVEDTGQIFPLRDGVTTVGRGSDADISLEHSSVSRLHAEIVRRGAHVYVSDLGLSANGTRVNGRPVGRRVLLDGDVVSFGIAHTRVGGLGREAEADTSQLRLQAPDLTRRELEVLTALCRPALQKEAFVAPASAREIAEELVVTEAAVKQHLLRLYHKFRIAEGGDRRARLANVVLSTGIVQPLPHAGEARPSEARPSEARPGGARAG